jgi:glycosyltransferase involved in cell wall biosynthesis/LmbE family N-acetylglucosaminyl deacetylase
MKNEQELIPYTASDLTGKRVLTLAPHPDDETIGCGGSLALHVQAGDPVKVVFLTNGAKGDSTGRIDKDEYVALRHMEAEEACKHLGITDVEFWAYEDRALASSKGKLSRLIDLLNDFKPELVYVPSPLEFHPDHRSAALLLEDAVSNCESSFDIAFYEANQPLRVNVLVNITPVLQTKLDAIECYQTQLREMPYGEICLSLNKFRSLTLAKEITHAEGFSLWKSTLIRKIGFLSALSQDYGRLYPTIAESGPLVSIIIRTRNRPDLLANAVKSVCRQTYTNIELIVINDGGEDVEDVVRGLCKDIPVNYMAHESNRGRSAAANTGLKAAKGNYINFLDDDDIFYPHHVEKLIAWISLKRVPVAYSNVLSVYFDRPPYLTEHCKRDELNYNIGFDPDRILFQNYIPLMSVMFEKKNLDKTGLFDEDLSVFEDWDLWIRMSRHFTFSHVDEVTAEYRFYGSESIVQSHRQKYEYDKNQAKIFDRIIPHLNGELWIKFLKSPYINSLRKIDNEDTLTPQSLESFSKNGNAVNRHLEQISKIQLDTQDRTLEILARFDELSKTNHAALSNLKSFSDHDLEQRRTLQEIYASKSWKCLQLYRKIRHHSARMLRNARVKKNPGNMGKSTPFPEVSIVIPAYNGGRYIEDCLNSATNQSFSNIEIIIADDCSEDDTFQKVRDFMREDRRIAYFKNDVNLGLVMNWNKCLENCRGKWIKFLFQDDLLHPHSVETMLKSSFEDANGGFPRLIIGERDFIIEDGISDVFKNYYEHHILRISDITENTSITPEDFSVAMIKAGIGVNFIGEPSSVMLRKDIFSDYSLFNVNLVQLCDLEYWTRIGSNETIRYIPETLASFRVHKDAASTFNHLHQAFQVHLLDKVILLHDYLFHPLYRRFRATIGGVQQLEKDLNETLLKSLNHIQQSNNTRDRNCFFELLSKYPSLKFYMPNPEV